MRMTSPSTNFARRRGDPLPIPFHPSLDCQLGLDGLDDVACLAFFPESDHSVGHQQQKDDEKLRPVPDHAQQNHSNLDPPRDGFPKIAEEFQKQIRFLFGQLIRPILGQPLLRRGLGEAPRRRLQLFLHLRQRQRFQVIFWIGLGPRFTSGHLGFDSGALGWSVWGSIMAILLSWLCRRFREFRNIFCHAHVRSITALCSLRRGAYLHLAR